MYAQFEFHDGEFSINSQHNENDDILPQGFVTYKHNNVVRIWTSVYKNVTHPKKRTFVR